MPRVRGARATDSEVGAIPAAPGSCVRAAGCVKPLTELRRASRHPHQRFESHGFSTDKENILMNTQVLTTSVGAAVAALLLTSGAAFAKGPHKHIDFNMVVSAGAATCLPHARAEVRVVDDGTAQDLYLFAQGLPPKTDFDFFVIQVPKAPFGMSWYQADVETDEHGNAFQHVRGIFGIETFTVAPNAAPAPVVFNGPFPDASVNPATNPIQMYHLGLWFDSPTDAQNAGCPASVTPFNGEHDAGLQVLNTANFADEEGPLRQLK